MKGTLLAFALAICLAPATASRSEPTFGIPVDCVIGETCWLVNYPDVDPATGRAAARDFTCGPRSYDGHKGTDFAVRSMREVADGVDVLAAADGEVLRVRDGELDARKSDDDFQSIRQAGRECGNGIIMDHGEGWQTIYCHLKRGSVAVNPGETIVAGQAIGQVGRSGIAEFPHVHLGVTRDDETIDPFTGAPITAGCSQRGDPLWTEDLPYDPVSIYDAGFFPGVPDFDTIEEGQAKPVRLTTSVPAFVFWVAIYGVREGDQIDLEIIDPSGRLYAEQRIIQEKTRARQYYYTGRRVSAERPLIEGEYTGRIVLRRGSLTRQIDQKIPIGR